MARARKVIKLEGADLLMDALREAAEKLRTRRMTKDSVHAKHKAIEMRKNKKGVYEAIARNRSRSK